MLPFFADPYPDELLYSVFARYHRWTGNPNLRSTLMELFKNNAAIPSLYFGVALSTLCENISGVYNSDDLITNHTLFPLYRPFLPQRRAEELRKQMEAADGNGLIAKIGIAAGSICQKNGIAYCPRCVIEDRRTYGEAYFHRLHQVQGVFICPKHRCMLRQIKVPDEASRIKYLDLECLRPEVNIVLFPDSTMKTVMQIVSDSSIYLLSNDLSFSDKERVTLRYKQILYQKGLLSDSGRVLQAEFTSQLQSFYCDNILRYFESEVSPDDEYTWPKSAVRSVKRTVHPLRHILLINFLDKSIESFFEGIKKGDIFTVKKRKELKPKNSSLLKKYKTSILLIIQNNPQVLRTQLRKMCRKEYSYIYRRDKTWLMDHLPDSHKPMGSSEVVDWHRRDATYIKKLRKSFEDCMTDGKRITVTRLIRRAGIQANMENHKDKLPQAWAYVKSVSQTVEEYQIERCLQIIRKFIEKDLLLKQWKLLRLAGLTKERFFKIKERLKQRLIDERMVTVIEWEVV